MNDPAGMILGTRFSVHCGRIEEPPLVTAVVHAWILIQDMFEPSLRSQALKQPAIFGGFLALQIVPPGVFQNGPNTQQKPRWGVRNQGTVVTITDLEDKVKMASDAGWEVHLQPDWEIRRASDAGETAITAHALYCFVKRWAYDHPSPGSFPCMSIRRFECFEN